MWVYFYSLFDIHYCVNKSFKSSNTKINQNFKTQWDIVYILGCALRPIATLRLNKTLPFRWHICKVCNLKTSTKNYMYYNKINPRAQNILTIELEISHCLTSCWNYYRLLNKGQGHFFAISVSVSSKKWSNITLPWHGIVNSMSTSSHQDLC